LERQEQGLGSDLVSELVERLTEKGLPQGAWLVDIEQAIDDLERAARTLRRMRDALIRRG